MPRKSDSIPINNEKLDRRVKLTQEEKDEIFQLYQIGDTSQRKLATQFGVSRRSIQFILDPDKLVENKKRREERGGTARYYDKESHAKSMKEHRDYKKQLFQEGKITEDKNKKS